METVKEGEIQRRRDSMYEMFEGFWRSCIQPTDGLPGRKQDGNLEPFIVSDETLSVLLASIERTSHKYN